MVDNLTFDYEEFPEEGVKVATVGRGDEVIYGSSTIKMPSSFVIFYLAILLLLARDKYKDFNEESN